VRLFVAVDPDPVALDDLDRALAPVREAPGHPRWTARELWHVTLAFLGELPPERLSRLASGLAVTAAATPPLRLQLSGFGAFPARGVPQVLWVGLTGELDRLGRLARAAARSGRAAGAATERRTYRPHITLGRWRRGDPADRGLTAGLDGYAGPPFQVGEIALVRSHLGASPRHERLESWPLAGT
jgi:RNA 2',3'-cyclic 3'-phosphodiesterase